MNRRDFSLQAMTAVGLSGLNGLALAQGARAEEGKQYIRVRQPASVSEASKGKIEVVEFFWYGCSHCNAFEPVLEAWSKTLPKDVFLRRVPVAFRNFPFTLHQRLFYALEAMGLVSTVHPKVFDAIHRRGLALDSPEKIGAFVAANGVDQAKFMSFFNSFKVTTQASQAKTLAEAYNIDGVPAIGVAGRFWTSVSHNKGSHENTLATANQLIQLMREGR